MAGYRVVHSDEFDDDLKKAGPDDHRMVEVLTAIKDALSRNPLVGREVDRGVRMIFGHPRQAMPVAFYYVINGQTVELVGARQVGM